MTSNTNGYGRRELATFGGGCFWCLDGAFRLLRGVARVESGYAGGSTERPTYQQVCTGRTGHAEVVQITFDPTVISYRDLLDVFFTIHDPTTMNRQGADVGTQYRSIILYHSEEQRAEAERTIAEIDASGSWSAPAVTQVEPLTEFHPAEPEHQDYYARNPSQGYCAMVIQPKIAKLRKYHMERLKL